MHVVCVSGGKSVATRPLAKPSLAGFQANTRESPQNRPPGFRAFIAVGDQTVADAMNADKEAQDHQEHYLFYADRYEDEAESRCFDTPDMFGIPLSYGCKQDMLQKWFDCCITIVWLQHFLTWLLG